MLLFLLIFSYKYFTLTLAVIIILSIACIVFLFCWFHSRDTSKSEGYTQDGRIIVRVSMYNNSSYPEWRAYVEDQCPDVYIEWENNLNNVSNVLYRAKHDDIPDIISIRRFESDTVSDLNSELADLSGLNITKTFETKYLVPYRDGKKQCWLPEPGTIDGIVANKDVFEKYNVAIPTDMDTFISACKTLQENGVRAFDVDLADPWSPTGMLEGFGMDAFFNSEEGHNWLAEFKSGKATSVNGAGFTRIYGVLKTLKDNGILTEDDLTSDAASSTTRFNTGQSAMVRIDSSGLFSTSIERDCIMLPFYGASSDRNYLYTYPVFNLAMSEHACSSPKLQTACEKVLTAMLSEDAQKALDSTSEGLISYNKNISLKLSPAMDNIKPLIENERCFIRALNSNSFNANTLAVSALIKDDVSSEKFIDILNKNLFLHMDPTDIASSPIDASCEVDENSICPAASVIAETLSAETGSDCSIIDSDEAMAPIYKAEYDSSDVSAIVAASPVYTCTVTGSQLKKLLQSCIYYSTTFESGNIEPLIDYPALGGMTAVIKKNGTVDSILINGKKITDDADYKLSVSGNIFNAMTTRNNSLCPALKTSDQNLLQFFTKYFSDNGSLPQPVEYFEVR